MREGFLKHELHEVQTVLFPDWCHCSTALILQPWYGEALQQCSETEITLKEHLICCYFSINISIFLTLSWYSFTFRAGPQTQTHGSVSPSIQPEGLKWLFGALIQTCYCHSFHSKSARCAYGWKKEVIFRVWITGSSFEKWSTGLVLGWKWPTSFGTTVDFLPLEVKGLTSFEMPQIFCPNFLIKPKLTEAIRWILDMVNWNRLQSCQTGSEVVCQDCCMGQMEGWKVNLKWKCH